MGRASARAVVTLTFSTFTQARQEPRPTKLAVLEQRGADGDAGVQIAGEAKVAHATGKRPALRDGFKRGDV